MSEDQLQRLIAQLTQNNGKKSSLTSCTARYSGERNSAKLEEFLAATSTFMACENISDAEAIRGFPMLLQNEAATWWSGVKENVRDWDSLATLIRQTFAPRKLPYQIYIEIFKEKQAEGVPTDVFLNAKRALLATLPTGSHSEEQQINLLFGLLRHQIRERLQRNDVNTFEQLIQKARNIEEVLAEGRNCTQKQPAASANNTSIVQPNCTICNKPGHSKDVCWKNNEPRTNMIVCYGCGKSGVIRSKCETCNIKKTQEFSVLSLDANERMPQRSWHFNSKWSQNNADGAIKSGVVNVISDKAELCEKNNERRGGAKQKGQN